MAIIPARGGSKGIPDKNLQPVKGVPLVARAVRSALQAFDIDSVVVSTDSHRIGSVAEREGATVIQRPREISGDEASSESAIHHALEGLPDAETIVFIQCTSPFINPQDLDRAVRMVRSGEYDVVFSALPDHTFRWEKSPTGWTPLGHDMSKRPRRQELAPRVIETGAFYVFTRKGFLSSGSRFHGSVGVVEVSAREALEIDTLDDLHMARDLAHQMDTGDQPWPIDAVVFDFDGVHTDNYVYLREDGKESVRVNRGDGMGVGLLKAAGIPVVILSTEVNPVVSRRGEKLGVEVIQGQSDKGAALTALAEEKGWDLGRVVYVGNDVNDRDCLSQVGWPIVVADAAADVVPLARIQLTERGGEGAVREVADLILRAREKGTS